MKHVSGVAVKKKGGASHLDSWRRSSEWREIAKRQCEKLNRERLTKPKCGALRKLDGQPCQNLAMVGNGRCRFHGGKTPARENWHVTQWPNKRHRRAMKKLDRKLQDAERDRKELRQRLAAMTPNERARYEKKKKAMTPGPAAARARKRQEAKQVAEFRKLTTPAEKELSPEAIELQARREELEAQFRALEEIKHQIENESQNFWIGAFG